MTSRVFQDEINAAEQTTESTAVKAFVNTFGGNGSNIKSATRVGVDAAGNPTYKITYSGVVPSGGDFGGRISYTPTTWVRTYSLVGGKLVSPSQVERSVVQAKADDAGPLEAAKGRWITWVQDNSPELISDNEARAFTQRIESWTGSSQDLNKMMNVASVNLPFGASAFEGRDDDQGLGLTGGGGGGGGGGFTGPEYVEPDRRVVEDFVKGSMVSLVGTVTDEEIDRFTDIYLKDHRANFDTPAKTIDPAQSVIEAIRGTKEYQTIHQSRPESTDERTWISDRRRAAVEGGLTVGAQEDFAITQATVAGDIPDVQRAAGVEQFQLSGSARGTLMENKMRTAAQSLFQGVKK